jgi:DNA replication protein DnaC
MSKREEAILPVLLGNLKLSAIKRLWEETAAEAEIHGWPYAKYLAYLCEQETSERDRRRLYKRMSEAALPKNKGIEMYDFSAIAGVTKEKILSLACGDVWIKEGMNVLIFGPSGVGKTHLAAAIGEKLVENGFRVFFTRTTEIVQKLQSAKKELSLPQALDRLDRYDCLILDDFGYVQKDECETSVLFELICERYERKSMLLTCNQSFKEWEDIFENKQMAVAAIDRIVHNASILEISAESYRKKQAMNRMKKEKEVVNKRE